MNRTNVEDAVTALFVPGDRPDRFARAAAAGADLVVIDLEDAVGPARRAAALQHVVDALLPDPVTGRAARSAVVRVTGSDSPTHRAEVDRLLEVALQPGHGMLGLMVPKASDPGVVGTLAARAQTVPAPVALVALVETAAGVQSAPALARVPGVTRLALGALDLALDLDAEPGSDTMAYARARLVVASRAAGLPGPLDSPSVEIADLDAVGRAARRARADGFGGQLCIHPAQVAVVRAAFAPSDADRRWAEAVLAAESQGATQVAGRMIDRPVLERARRLQRRPDPTGPERIEDRA